MKSRYWIAFLALIVAGCNTAVDRFEVSGKVDGHFGAWIYLDQVAPKANVPVDSVLTGSDGAFTLHTATAQPGVYSLRLPNRQSLLFFANEKPVTVNATQGQFSSGKVTGNTESQVLEVFNRVRTDYRNAYIDHKRQLQAIQREQEPEKWSAKEMDADKAAESYRNYVEKFADTVSNPQLEEYAIFNLNPEADFYSIQQWVEEKKASGYKSPFVNFMESSILDHGKDFLRFEAIDFASPTISGGDSVSLKSQRGKVVFLYFWASYCGLSRMENARLAKWYDEHPNSQIEIMSVSIDRDSVAWRQAVADDKMHWPLQIRGNSDWGSLEAKQFNLSTIPTTYVLDAKGIIRSKNLHASELARDYDKIVARWGAK